MHLPVKTLREIKGRRMTGNNASMFIKAGTWMRCSPREINPTPTSHSVLSKQSVIG